MKVADIAGFKNHLGEYLAAAAHGEEMENRTRKRAAGTRGADSVCRPQPHRPRLRHGYGSRQDRADRSDDPE